MECHSFLALVIDAHKITRVKRAGGAFPPAAWHESQVLELGQTEK